MTQRELYLHIGMPKTGTTALQNFFYINQAILKSCGITYPLNDVWYMAHHHLGWSLEEKSRKINQPVGLKSADEEWSLVLKSDAVLNCNDRILVSAETLARCGQESLLRIREYTSDYDVKIVLYLRRQDRMMSSLVNQMTKYFSHTWTDETDAFSFSHRNYTTLLGSWAAVFGKENLIVRPYEKGQFYGGAIFSDFLHHVFGLELTDAFQLPETDYNPRLHRVALEYKRLLNFLELPIEQKRATVEPLVQFSRQLAAEGRDDFDVFPPSQRLAIVQQHAASNAQVAREYLGRADGKLFYDPLPDPSAPWKPCQGLSCEDIRRISQLIFEHDHELAGHIGAAIKAGLKTDQRMVRQAAKKLKGALDTLLTRRTDVRPVVPSCKRWDERLMRFIFRKFFVSGQLALKKLACKLKINE